MFYQIYVKNADAAIALYQQAFDAKLLNEMRNAEGVIVHAEMDVFGHILALSESALAQEQQNAGNTMQFCIQFQPEEESIITRAYQALQGGASVNHPLGKCFYSECMTDLTDRFGVRWCLFI